MAHYQKLLPTIEVQCAGGHVTERILEDEFNFDMIMFGCSQCYEKLVAIRWTGLKPHNIDSVEEKG